MIANLFFPLLVFTFVCESVKAKSVTTNPIITLPDGVSLQGSISSSGIVNTFLGIPYAIPPVNDRRWNPPIKWVNETQEILDVSSYGQACTQRKQGSLYGGEDCLYLNVFIHTKHIPITEGLMLPVAFWIHGGTYISGDASQYDAQEIINLYDGHVILVTINYRLNIFGFLGSEELRQLDVESGSTGTLGLQDQRLAMQWVQDNIVSFGGDVNAITLYGQSAGAGSISSHLSMKKSQGLFSAVILESGGFAPWIAQNMTNAQKVYENVLQQSQCFNLTCLQELSTSELYDISQLIQPVTNILPTAFIPAVDFVELFAHPWVTLSTGTNITNVPILLGTNADEGVSYLPATTPTTLTEFEFFYMLIRLFDFGEYREEIEELYLTNATYPEEYDSSGALYSEYWWAGQRFIGDYFFSCPTQYALEQLLSETRRAGCVTTDTNVPEDLYCSEMFAYHNQYQLANRGAFVQHGYELPLVFHLGEHLTTEADVSIADKVATYWGNFFIARVPSLLTSGVTFLMDEEVSSWDPYSLSIMNITTFSDGESSPSIYSTHRLKSAECTLLNSILLKNMQKEYPYAFSDLPAGNTDNKNASSSSFFDDFMKKGLYILFAIVCVLVIGVYGVYQLMYGVSHQQAQRFLALQGHEGPLHPSFQSPSQSQSQTQTQAQAQAHQSQSQSLSTSRTERGQTLGVLYDNEDEVLL